MHNPSIMDSFGHYVQADMPKKWDQSGTDNTILAGAGRFGNVASGIEGFGGGIKRNALPTTAPYNWTVRFGLRIDGSLAGFVLMRAVYIDGFGTDWIQARIRVQGGGRLAVIDNAGTTVGESTTFAFQTQVWYFIEIVGNYSAVGTVDIYVNEVNVLSCVGDFEQSITLTGVNQIYITPPDSGNSFRICDLSITEGVALAIGDTRVVLLKPNADGLFTEWTTSTGSVHYTLVDDTPRDSSDYVFSDTIGQRELFAAEDTTGTWESIFGVQEVLYPQTLSATNTAVHYVNQVVGPQITDLSRYDLSLWLVEPVGTTTWSQADIDGVQFGMKVT